MQNSDLARNRLDDRFKTLPPSGKFTRPHKGWIRAIRDALGMTTGELASRMGVRQQTISDIERSEQHDTIQLKTLERAAQAMNCRLVYALVPDSTLEETVNAQARRKAIQHLESVAHHSRLEDQAVGDNELSTQIDELAALLASRRGLWAEPTISS
ncbi:mobile mystery protein A [Candidatus Poriferisocius sp.]|uniref:mobile mystery protein A n=1 Tax=Candidatus Poriferisocius sp. TaxID=3101276 RepID=UPI003B017837